jgi:hypothetical protein
VLDRGGDGCFDRGMGCGEPIDSTSIRRGGSGPDQRLAQRRQYPDEACRRTAPGPGLAVHSNHAAAARERRSKEQNFQVLISAVILHRNWEVCLHKWMNIPVLVKVDRAQARARSLSYLYCCHVAFYCTICSAHDELYACYSVRSFFEGGADRNLEDRSVDIRISVPDETKCSRAGAATKLRSL